MKNRYPKACSICQGLVQPGEGTLRKEGPGWTVTHSDACPRGEADNGNIRHGHARAYTRRVLGLLRRTDASIEEVEEAVGSLAALARTGWTTVETCERILLSSKALEQLDRFAAERLLSQLLPEESNA